MFWAQVEDAVTASITAMLPTLRTSYRRNLKIGKETKLRDTAWQCFQMFGYDMVLTEDGVPTIIEVVNRPSFAFHDIVHNFERMEQAQSTKPRKRRQTVGLEVWRPDKRGIVKALPSPGSGFREFKAVTGKRRRRSSAQTTTELKGKSKMYRTTVSAHVYRRHF